MDNLLEYKFYMIFEKGEFLDYQRYWMGRTKEGARYECWLIANGLPKLIFYPKDETIRKGFE